MSELAAASGAAPRRVFVWDLPVRLFHWSLVALVGVLYVTAEVMDDGIETHALAGYTVLALVLFRLVWGFVGGTHARFGGFVRTPGAAFQYARALFRGAAPLVPGHNPLGGWMVIALLAVLLVQAGLGLFSNDDILFDGPLHALVDKETSDRMTALHADLFNGLLVLVALHVAAVVYHKVFRGENLVPAMLTGYKELPPEEEAEPSRSGHPLLAAVVLALCAGAVYWLVR